MARSFEITSLEVSPQYNAEGATFPDVVISINFRYGEGENLVSGSCPLNPHEPDGSFLPLESVSKELALQWLLACNRLNKSALDQQLDYLVQLEKNPPFEYNWTDPSLEVPEEV